MFSRRSDADRELLRALQRRHPRFKEAVLADLALAAPPLGVTVARTRAVRIVQVVKVAFVSDAFAALVAYRIKTSLQRAGVPVLPRLAHRFAIVWGQVTIGDPVLIHPGLHLPHGQVVIDGFVEIHAGALIRPFVTIGLREGHFIGPTIGPDVQIGTGAKLIGEIRIGRGAQIGANAVVLADVPDGARAVGVPARVVTGRT